MLPEDLHAHAVALVHALAHQGMANSETLLTSRLLFPSFSTTLRAELHTVSSKQLEPAGLTPTPPIPFHTLSMDFKGLLMDSSQNPTRKFASKQV